MNDKGQLNLFATIFCLIMAGVSIGNDVNVIINLVLSFTNMILYTNLQNIYKSEHSHE